MHTAAQPPIVLVTASSADADGRTRVRVNAAYTDALERAGLVPLVVPPLADAELVTGLVRVARGIVLTGGEDVDPNHYGAVPHPATGASHARRDATELALVQAARAASLPTLAICRGVQLLNVALGGTLVQDLPTERPGHVPHDQSGARAARTHAVAVAADSELARSLGAVCIPVNSLHHQALDHVAADLRVTARADDGVIEGVESARESWWCVGVQWHPEELVECAHPWDRRLFARFAERVRAGGAS